MLKERNEDEGDLARLEAANPVPPAVAPQEEAIDEGLAFDPSAKGETTALAPEMDKGPAVGKAKPETPTEPEDNRRHEAAPRSGRRPVVMAAGAVFLALALGAGALWWNYADHFETTDDAFIASRPIAIAPKVSGYVAQVAVTDNQHVAKGAVIARIDDRDYRIALSQAEANVAAAEAGVKNVDAQIAVQRAQVEARRAQVQQTQAALQFAKEQASRYDQLARKGAGSIQKAQQYSSQLAQNQAALKSAQAAVLVAQSQVQALQAQRVSAEAKLAQAQAARDQARLNLSYTVVKAAEPGRIVALSAAPGEYAQPGAKLAILVPDKIWVTANFKETQLDRMRPGEKATLTIDAYPDRTFHGHIASVQPGSGTAFALLPAENATGNYVKIVQRVPVKIIIDHPPEDVALGPGMSVVPSVRVDPSPSLYERLVAAFDRQWSKW